MTFRPEFILAVVSALCIGVAWLVRLEAKVNRANERHDDFRKDTKDTFHRLEQDFRDWRGGPIKIDRLPGRD